MNYKEEITMKQTAFNFFFATMFMVGVVTTLTGLVLTLNYLSTQSFAIM